MDPIIAAPAGSVMGNAVLNAVYAYGVPCCTFQMNEHEWTRMNMNEHEWSTSQCRIRISTGRSGIAEKLRLQSACWNISPHLLRLGALQHFRHRTLFLGPMINRASQGQPQEDDRFMDQNSQELGSGEPLLEASWDGSQYLPGRISHLSSAVHLKGERGREKLRPQLNHPKRNLVHFGWSRDRHCPAISKWATSSLLSNLKPQPALKSRDHDIHDHVRIVHIPYIVN